MTSPTTTIGAPHTRHVGPNLPIIELLERRNFLSAAHHHLPPADGGVPRNPTLIGQVIPPATPTAALSASVLNFAAPAAASGAVSPDTASSIGSNLDDLLSFTAGLK